MANGPNTGSQVQPASRTHRFSNNSRLSVSLVGQQQHHSPFGAPQVPLQYPQRRGTKRQRTSDDDPGESSSTHGLALHLPMLPTAMGPGDPSEQSPFPVSAQSEGSHHQSHPQSAFQSPAIHQHHHHHRLPSQATPVRLHRTGVEMTSPGMGAHESLVGHEGMPEPAARPKGPKLKFTPEEDAKLVDLKENKNMTWKQIADFFPGRTSGTLQVRYCTKLKAKQTVWTDDTVQRLRNAIQEYENDRWRLIAAKVGSGFTPAACRDKASELEM
ncbi:MAG: hypothetical protein Q9227_000049 [Pyrenula ochraceoflavens]